MTTETGYDRSAVAETLHRIVMLKDQKKAIDEELRDLEGVVKAALEDDPTPLVDGERGLTAEIRTRSKGAEIDLMSFARKPENEKYLAELAQVGVLSARIQQWRGLVGKSAAADALKPFEMPGGEVRELRIERN